LPVLRGPNAERPPCRTGGRPRGRPEIQSCQHTRPGAKSRGKALEDFGLVTHSRTGDPDRTDKRRTLNQSEILKSGSDDGTNHAGTPDPQERSPIGQKARRLAHATIEGRAAQNASCFHGLRTMETEWTESTANHANQSKTPQPLKSEHGGTKTNSTWPKGKNGKRNCSAMTFTGPPFLSLRPDRAGIDDGNRRKPRAMRGPHRRKEQRPPAQPQPNKEQTDFLFALSSPGVRVATARKDVGSCGTGAGGLGYHLG